MMADEHEGFEIVDKRHKAEEETGEAPEPQPEPAAQPSESVEPGADAEAGGVIEGEQEQQMSADVPELLGYMLSLLGAASWQWLGLIANPATGKAEMDLHQAALAIDTFEDISKRLSPYVDEGTNGQIRQALSDMRINYVERAKGSS